MKIVFMFESPILYRDIERYQIKQLNVIVEEMIIFDLSPLFQPIASRELDSEKCDYDIYKIIQIRTKRDLIKLIGDYKTYFFVLRIGNGFAFHSIYKELYRNKIKYSVILPEAIPALNQSNQKAITFVEKIKRRPLASLFGSIYKRLQPFINIQQASYFLYYGNDLNGAKKISSNYPKGNMSKYVSISSSSVVEETNNDINIGDYILFVDQGLPWHPDLITNKMIINEELYVKNINSFLNYLSSETGLRVVIALHPRVSYPADCFDKSFTLIKNNTKGLVGKSRFVVYMFSEAFNYIIMYNKPILPISMKCIDDVYARRNHVRPLSIGANILEIDNIEGIKNRDIDYKSYLYYNEEEYCKYAKRYIFSEEKGYYLADFIKEIQEKEYETI